LIAALLFHFSDTAKACSMFEQPASLAKWELFKRLLAGIPVDVGDQRWRQMVFPGPVFFGSIGEDVLVQIVFVQVGELLPVDPDGPSFVGETAIG
jgi:hypothetical protein